jgi:hypothetical protein
MGHQLATGELEAARELVAEPPRTSARRGARMQRALNRAAPSRRVAATAKAPSPARGIGAWAFRILFGLTCLKILAALVAFALLPRAPAGPFPLWIFAAHLIAFGAVGFALAIGSARDDRARDLGLVYLLLGSLFGTRPLGTAAEVLSPTPALLSLLLASLHPDAFLPLFLWKFSGRFPREAPIGWLRAIPPIAVRVTFGAGVLLFANNLANAASILWPGTLRIPEGLVVFSPESEQTVYWLVLLSLLVPCLPYMMWRARAASANERRRAELLVAGFVVGTAPMLLEVLAEILVPPFKRFMDRPTAERVVAFILYPLTLSTPLTTAYAVVTTQVLDVRLIVRRAIRYALARATVFALVAVPFMLLVWYILQHQGLSLGQLLSGPQAFAFGGLTALGLAMIALRRRLLEQLDRRFFREQYDAQRTLATLMDQSRRADTVRGLVALLDGEIDRALHLDAVATLVLDANGRQFQAPDGAVPPLPSDAALVTLVRGSTEPMDVDLEQAETPLARLPLVERDWLAECGFRLLVPLSVREGALVGVLGLGQKKSELPFSAEDRLLLATIASSGAMSLENLRLRTPADGGLARPLSDQEWVLAEDAAVECPRCGVVFDRNATGCPTCGGKGSPAPVPLILRATFRIERKLGAGGMGVVYRAMDLTLGRIVAIKTLPALSAEKVMRLRREARAMATVVHPHLATIFGAEMWHGTPMLVVEYLENGTLADRLRQGWLAVAEVVELGIALASALERLHGRGLLHRDIKPSNIGFTGDRVPKLLDFGLVKFLEAPETLDPSQLERLDPEQFSAAAFSEAQTAMHPASPGIIGTPLYFSPETVMMQPAEAIVDLWALALVLFESLTGQHPMKAPTLRETFERILRGPRPDARSLRADCSPALAAFFEKALHADPGHRPASAREFRNALERLHA